MTQEDDTRDCSRRCSRAISYWLENGMRGWGESIPSVPGENLKIGLELADRHAIYFLFLVFLLVPLVGAALL
jgi:hypothetical protein